MAAIFEHISPSRQWGFVLWRWQANDQTASIPTVSDRDHQEHITHPVRAREYMASRLAMQHMCRQLLGHEVPVIKDQHQKPWLLERQEHISIAHHFPYAAALLHRTGPAGLDMEEPREQLRRIAHKFLRANEAAWAKKDLDRLCIIWTAKEALYKAYGRKELVFKENLFIEELPDTFSDSLQYRGVVYKDGQLHHHQLHTRHMEGMWLTHTC